MPDKFNELLLKQDIIELYNAGITPDYGYLMNGRFEKDMIKTLYPLKTLSGNPISWEASDTEYLFPVISLEPKQAGSGDPSPENVRPISGYDEVSVNVRGKNLFDFEKYLPNKAYLNGITAEKVAPGTWHIYGTLTGDRDINILSATIPEDERINLPSGVYSIQKQILVTFLNDVGYKNYYNTFTLNKESSLYGFYAYVSRGTTVDFTVMAMIVYGNATPTLYTPYVPGTTIQLSLPETIYGGTVDAVTGVGNEDWKLVTLTGNEQSHIFNNYFYLDGFSLGEGIAEGVCSHYPYKSYSANSIGINAIGTSVIYVPADDYTPDQSGLDSWKSYLAAQASAGTPVQVAYKLATPEPFQATGNQALTSLLGYNTIYTNGDSITLKRKARRLEV